MSAAGDQLRAQAQIQAQIGNSSGADQLNQAAAAVDAQSGGSSGGVGGVLSWLKSNMVLAAAGAVGAYWLYKKRKG